MNSQQLLSLWKKMNGLPFGNSLFSFFLSRSVPYSGSICPRVLHLEPGRVEVQMKDRRRVRNHLHSVHAIALINLGELASGLAVLSSLPPDWRGIVTRLEIDYLKKARGTLTARCRVELDSSFVQKSSSQVFQAEAEILDVSGEVVSRVKAHWLLGPRVS